MGQWRRVVQMEKVAARASSPSSQQGLEKHAPGKTGGYRKAATPPQWVQSVGGFLDIPEVSLVGGAEEFRREYVNKSQPAVIKVNWIGLARLCCAGLDSSGLKVLGKFERSLLFQRRIGLHKNTTVKALLLLLLSNRCPHPFHSISLLPARDLSLANHRTSWSS